MQAQLSSKQSTDKDLIINELIVHKIIPNDGGYSIAVGDDLLPVKTLQECLQLIEQGLKELKTSMQELWQNLAKLSGATSKMNGKNNLHGFENVYFLSNAKKVFLLARLFPELEKVTDSIHGVLDVDLQFIDDADVKKFNFVCLRIFLMHRLIMSEIYRRKLVLLATQNIKLAQISGPWANLDLPMKERMWEWSEDEEYFKDRQDSKREQARYNPETNPLGFYFVWQDQSRGPYSYFERNEEGTYPHDNYLSIP